MVVNWSEINWTEYLLKFGISPRNKKRRSKRDNRDIINVYSAFDIETSTVWLDEDRSLFDVHSFMYSWAFQIEEYTVLGRWWADYFVFLKTLKAALEEVKKQLSLDNVPRLLIWVHNLSYEWAWLSGLYPFTSEECFFRDVRKPIYCRMFDVFEYRCSYIQTNLSLAMLCKQMGVPEKLSGQKFNYDKIRYPWTKLTDFEKAYIITDVESLVLAMKKRVQMNGDNLTTVPLTSTGYVRRECKESLYSVYYDIRDMKPDERQFRLLRKAFRGGNTHANRAYAGKIIDDVYSFDIVSCYPNQQLTERFPMKPFKWLDGRLTLDRVFKFIGLGYAVVGLYQFKGLHLKNKKTPIPYISLSRTDTQMYEVIDDGFYKNGKPKTKKLSCVKLDNGRILESKYTEIALTEIDLEIVLDQYDFDEVQIVDCMVAQKDYLPESYRNVIQNYYNLKTKLKGAETDEEEYLYIKSKNMLNSVYGMSATSPLHPEIIYENGKFTENKDKTAEEKAKMLKSAPFPYQWGVWTTSLARAQLQRAINLCGNKIVYCDTDSVKTIGKIDLSKLNDHQLTLSKKRMAFADDRKGNRHYIGIFEEDAHYEKFITQGAKRYAYIKNGHLGVTVSGVTKKRNEETGEMYAVEELKTLENFKPGMIWRDAGGTMAVFNDHDDFDLVDPETGFCVRVTKNVAIIPTTYEMTHEKDYSLLLHEIKLYGEYKSGRE